MGLYEAAKDALKVAQSADNVELVQKLLDVQKMALDMQEKEQELRSKITGLEQDNQKLREKKKYTYEPGHKWLIDPEKPEIKLCPTCMNRDDFESPLGSPGHAEHRYCGNCKNSIN